MSVLAIRLLIVSCVLLGSAIRAQAQSEPQETKRSPAQIQTRPLRVATGLIAPFVLKQGDQLTGFSVDLWNALTRQLEVTSSFVEFKSSAEQLQAVERGDVDVAISAITMTAEREELVDFSHPYFDSGLQIMVRTQGDDAWVTLRSLVSPALRRFLGATVIIVFLFANVLWLV